MTNEHYLAFQQLDVYRAARELCERVHKAQISHAVLRDQAGRASMSCFLQLAEGLPNDGAGLRNKYFVEADSHFKGHSVTSPPPSASLRHRDPFSVGRTSPCARGSRKESLGISNGSR